MIDNTQYKSHFVGRDGFIWWIGQVASEESWNLNQPDELVEGNEDVRGFAERYKVRIMGYHTAIKSELPDDDLPWASVMYPVTAGGGGKSNFANANIHQGDFVFGFFIDGEDGQQPVIFGVLGYNEYQAVMSQVPDTGFVPFTGYRANEAIATYSLLANPAATSEIATQQYSTGQINNQTVISSTTPPVIKSAEDTAEAKPKPSSLPTAQPEKTFGANNISTTIRDLIQDVENVRKTVYDVRYRFTNKVNNIEKIVQEKINWATEKISAGLVWVYGWMEGKLLEGLNKALNLILNNVPSLQNPTTNDAFKVIADKVPDFVACFFKKLIINLPTLVTDFLGGSIQKIINVPRCFVNNFLANVVGEIAGRVAGFVSSLASAITGAIGAVAGFIDDVLSLISDVLNFLLCSGKSEPKEARLHEWNIAFGPVDIEVGGSDGGIGDIIERAKGLAESFTDIGEGITEDFEDLLDPDIFEFDLSQEKIFDTENCNAGPLECGTPEVVIRGAGKGALGNAIIGLGGEIIGVDVVNFGKDYDGDEGDITVRIKDGCGKGKNAQVRAQLGRVTLFGGDEE